MDANAAPRTECAQDTQNIDRANTDGLMAYTKPQRISLKAHTNFNELWVQQRISDDPTILGIGDLILRDRERIQRRAGRLDLLLQDPDTKRRYEVELQLGSTDEGHIIRTIEYWDNERKRYPQYEHCAVLVAEDVTSRFLNVVSLFNGTIPLIALQMQAFEVGEHTTLVFTTIIDELTRGVVDEDEDADAAPTDRAYWEQAKGTKDTVAMVDEALDVARTIDPTLELKYNKFYIGLARNRQPFNFVWFRPTRMNMTLHFRIKQTDEIDAIIDSSGLDAEYNDRTELYRIRIRKGGVKKHTDSICNLMNLAYKSRNG